MMTSVLMEPRVFLRSLFEAAVSAAWPRSGWFADLERPRGRTIVVSAGKAAASMAAALEQFWGSPLDGLVVVPYGHGVPTRWVEVVEAGHPVPDEAGLAAARRILSTVGGLSDDDLVVALVSGGGSSLLTLPAPGLELAEKQTLTRELLRCGASIGEINAVRKHLSAIKGGRLLAACAPARVVTFVVSDVPGDDPSVVASGPTLVDSTPPGEARRVVDFYGLTVPPSIRRLLESEPPPVARTTAEVRIVASAMTSLQAAAAEARRLGVEPRVLSDAVQGEAREVAKAHAILAMASKPSVLLSGGETTVNVRGNGRGGRNVEYLASLAQELRGHPRIHALAADTDGIDGSAPNAGAFVDPSTFARAGARLEAALADNDAHTLFESLGDALVTGPTRTNVNDFRAILVAP